ncbi:MAG: DJ-1/PfpI family protein [Clostridium sp.]|uniref:DJ-1 family glyoxalase III n=1 Tax=Clostridium sp. DSM 8431 TaxID=1761781 RepID=UPI0008EDF3DE|nr:DJ-1 family glyoxalase III [Clostridium sp. DSM 8431]MCR4944756.1 DJ-1/PfpI family protein [Clostridium sp.]SFU65490.1 4-methyl-5(b-hydroxyethyl)-thiazole monophosphate biosynthesis [Clostridium sp. DSM 8431]
MKKTAVLLAEGFEEIEALTVVDIIRRGNVECHMVSIKDLEVIGAHGIKVIADKVLSEDINEYDLIVFPGGMPGATNLKEDKKVLETVKKFNKEGKLIAAICAAPIVLAAAGIVENKNITSYPGFEEELKGCNYKEENVVIDGNIITSRGPATAMEFGYELLKVLGNETYNDLKKGMLYNK